VRVRFSVQDTGIGIPAQAQARLFQRFRQADAATAASYGGSGLGLSICQGLVERMGGRIGFDSTPGVGTTFRFQLDFARAAPPAPAQQQRLDHISIGVDIADADERGWIVDYLRNAGATISGDARLLVRDDAGDGLMIEGGTAVLRLPHPQHRSALLRALAQAAGLAPQRPVETAAAAAPAHRLRILAVDDHPSNQHVVQRQLALLGHDADLAADGEQALRLLDRGHYDVLLTDLRMPGVDGFALAREIRRREASGEKIGRLPILAMTAQVAAGDEAGCAAAGMDGHLSKPCSLADLRRALANWSDAAPAAVGFPAAAQAGDFEVRLDRAFLLELLGGDAALAQELEQDFIRINTPLLPELTGLAGSANLAALEALTHRLLGSARTAGAKPLARVLADLETAAQQKQETACRTLAQQAGVEFARVRENPN